MTDPVEFRYAARSDVGLVRSNNQDSGYAGQNLLVLADGMGGPAGGDIASSIALAHFVPLDGESHSAEHMLPLLRSAMQDAHQELVDRSATEPALKGLGTTCIAILRSSNKLAMIHIGDSRAYLLRGTELTQVTTDHSFVQYLVDSGQITQEEAEHHPQRNVVLRILGDSSADVTPDETIREAVLGDRWLLCSDGLSGMVSADTIAQTLTSVDDPGQCAEELIDLALKAGGSDNITCVIADVVPQGTSGQNSAQVVGAASIERRLPTRGGSSPAAKAAALSSFSENKKDTAKDFEDVEDTERQPSPQRWWVPLLTLFVLALVCGGGWLGYAWSQTQYYVIAQNNAVVIYQGIPQSIGAWDLSHPVEVTDIEVTDLSPVDRDRLREPVVRASRLDIDAYVLQLRNSGRLWKAEEPQVGNTSQSGASAQSGLSHMPSPNGSSPAPSTSPRNGGGN